MDIFSNLPPELINQIIEDLGYSGFRSLISSSKSILEKLEKNRSRMKAFRIFYNQYLRDQSEYPESIQMNKKRDLYRKQFTKMVSESGFYESDIPVDVHYLRERLNTIRKFVLIKDNPYPKLVNKLEDELGFSIDEIKNIPNPVLSQFVQNQQVNDLLDKIENKLNVFQEWKI
jgi:hypothetical protein